MDNIYLKVLFDWLHIMATISWFGGMFTNMILVRPTILKVLDPPTAGKFMNELMKKTRIVVYVSIAVLFISGIPMKIINENYVSIINFSNNWQIVTFVKHVFVGILTLLAIFNFEILMPKAQKSAANGPSDELNKLKKSQEIIGKLSFLSAMIIIILSAIMLYI